MAMGAGANNSKESGAASFALAFPAPHRMLSENRGFFGHVNTNLFNLFNSMKIPWLQPEHVVNRVLAIIVLAVVVHFLVLGVRFMSDWLIRKSAAKKMPVGFVTQQPKFITVTGLIASALTFAVYFFAIGLVLHEYQVNLTTYLATASVIGLAVGFGSQGLVQDVVAGLTLILSDTLDVGDVIEVAGKIGRVERVGLRFTQLNNFFNQQVYVPNRVIADISRFPGGEMSAFADVQIPSDTDSGRVRELVERIAKGMWSQFNAIILSEPQVSDIETVETSTWRFLRVHFKIWPGQGSLIETAFRQRVVEAMKAMQPNYADWMVTVTYRASVV
jgi:small-conductance mechanosensitive channel